MCFSGVEFYNLRGGKERIFDDMNNGLGWSRLPKSFMAENTVFLLLSALIHNFYKTIMSRLDTKAFGLKKTSRIKAFVFRFISVPAKCKKQVFDQQFSEKLDSADFGKLVLHIVIDKAVMRQRAAVSLLGA